MCKKAKEILSQDVPTRVSRSRNFNKSKRLENRKKTRVNGIPSLWTSQSHPNQITAPNLLLQHQGQTLNFDQEYFLKLLHLEKIAKFNPKHQLPGAAPWARAIKNVKKPQSHVEKLGLRFLQNKPETFSASVTHLIRRLPYQ